MRLRHQSLSVVAAAHILAGCMQIQPDGNMAPPSEPALVQNIPGSIETFAACAYSRLEQGAVGVKLVDLRAIQTIRIYEEHPSSGLIFNHIVRSYDINIRQASTDQMSIQLRVPGGEEGGWRLWARIADCANMAQPAVQRR